MLLGYSWKLIPMHFIDAFGKKNYFSFKFQFQNFFIASVSSNFYPNILPSWKSNFSRISYTASCIRFQFLWFNNYITIHNNSVHFKEFSSQNINFINHLFTSEGEFKEWNQIKRKFQLAYNLYYKFTQISHALPKKWKQILRGNREEPCTIHQYNHFSVWKNQLQKSCTQFCSMKKQYTHFTAVF